MLRRLRPLGLSPEAEPRVLRFVDREVERALDRAEEQRWTEEEIRAAGGGDELVAALRQLREDQRRAAAIREAGLHQLSEDELRTVLATARERS
ncbi:MAG: hypothetical protein AB7N76_13975 [Planctomycetota bacterium]